MIIYVVRTGFDDFNYHNGNNHANQYNANCLGKIEIEKRAAVLKKLNLHPSRLQIVTGTTSDAIHSGRILKTAFGLDSFTLADWLNENYILQAYAGLQRFITRNGNTEHFIVVAQLLQMRELIVRIANEFKLAFYFNDFRTMYEVDMINRKIQALSPSW